MSELEVAPHIRQVTLPQTSDYSSDILFLSFSVTGIFDQDITTTRSGQLESFVRCSVLFSCSFDVLLRSDMDLKRRVILPSLLEFQVS